MANRTGFFEFLEQLRRIFSKREKLLALGILIMMIGGASLEMVGIGSIPAYVSVITNPDILGKYPAVQQFLTARGITTPEQLAYWGAIGLITIYLLKNGYAFILVYVQARYTRGRQVGIASRLFKAYLYGPYSFHLQRNSSDFIRNVNTESGLIINQGLNPLLNLVKESLLLVAIFTLLIVSEPAISFLAGGILGGLSLLFYWAIRRAVYRNAKTRQRLAKAMVQAIIEGMRGIKEIKVLGREYHFLKTFKNNARDHAQTALFIKVINGLPPLFLESISIIGMLGVTAVLVTQGRPVVSLVPTLTLFAVAMFRIMPTFNKLILSFTNIRSGLISLELVSGDLKMLEENRRLLSTGSKTDIRRLEHNIRLDNIRFQYEGGKDEVLSGVSIEIQKGRAIALVGPSGAGKTTLVDIVLGILTPTGGHILVDGKDIQEDLPGWQSQIGYIPQSIYLMDTSIRENIAMGVDAKRIDDDRVWQVLEMAQLKEFVEGLPDGLKSHIGEEGVRMSGGQRQRVGIARALYRDPTVLILDEATSSLDTETERMVVESVEMLRRDRTMIVIAHRLSSVQNCDQLYLIKNGNVAANGTYRELIEESKDFASMVMG